MKKSIILEIKKIENVRVVKKEKERRKRKQERWEKWWKKVKIMKDNGKVGRKVGGIIIKLKKVGKEKQQVEEKLVKPEKG